MADPVLEPLAAICVCPCGCGRRGKLRIKVMRDGRQHVHGCQCRRCVGSRASKNAGRRERKLALEVAGRRSELSGAVSGYDVGSELVRLEETAARLYVDGIRRWWEREAVRRKVAKVLGGEIPGAFVASWDGAPRVVVMDYGGFLRLLGTLAPVVEERSNG